MPYVPPKGARTITPVTVVNQTVVSGISTGGSSGGGAPVDAQYVVTSADATLTNERITTDTAEILWDTSTVGQLKATVGAIAESKVTNLVSDLLAKQANMTFSDEGTPLASPGVITSINFVGSGVTASAIGTAATVTIAGGSSTDAFYGDGSDGNLTVNGTVTLTNQYNYNTVTVLNGGKLIVHNWTLRCRELVINTGGIVGAPGNDAVGNGAGTAYSILGYAGSQGGAGGTGGNAGSGTAGSHGAATRAPTNALGQFARGGNGGGTALFPATASVVLSSTTNGRKADESLWTGGYTVRNTGWGTGGGGSGGSGDTGSLGGGGGGGGGLCYIATKSLTNSGLITCKGGTGGNASGTTNAGGGGGGGGGLLFIISGTPLAARGTIDVSGGAVGTSVGTIATAPAVGGNGILIQAVI